MISRISLFAGAALFAAGPLIAQTASFDPARLSQHVQTLSADSFEGRAPASRGEQMTVDYLIREFRAAGLQPGGEMKKGQRQWTQDVPLLRSEIVGAPRIVLNQDGAATQLRQGQEVALTAPLNGSTNIDIDSAPLLFVGYGVTAPERNWDDFKGQDVRGRILVVLINDPDFEGGEGNFLGKEMTYYGRWTYKYEEAARRGAAGVMIVHETEPASYGWNTVKNSWTGPQFDIVRDNPAAAHTAFESWIQLPVAEQLFQRSGLSFAQAKAMAKTRAFKPIPLDATLTAEVSGTSKTTTASNVVGLLPGTTRPDETVIYTAHHDHIGVGEPDANGDRIFNGAVDNATGIAHLIEQARAFARAPRTQRSVVFLAVGAEEQGLLGSKYYVANPLFPLAKTAGVLNTDSMGVSGPARDFSMSGSARLELLDLLIAEGRRKDRTFTPEQNPGAGLFFRSDHFPFAQAGVPAISFKPGRNLVNGGLERGTALAADYTAKRYHQPDDEFDPAWDFSGIVEDAKLLHAVGYGLANSHGWPDWSLDSEFRAVRDRTSGERRVPPVAPVQTTPAPESAKPGERG